MIKIPEGIEIRGKSIRISFSYRENRCRETLKGWEVTPANIKKAAQLRAVIISEITLGTFDYLSRFPTSNKALLFAPPKQIGLHLTVAQMFEKYSMLKQTTLSSQSHYVLLSQIKACIKFLGDDKLITNVTHIDALRFQQNLIKTPTRKRSPRSPETINHLVKLARRVFQLAKVSGYLTTNPFKDVTNLSAVSDGPDPLEPEEYETLIRSTRNEQQRNMFTVALYTGIRTGELCALAWEDINLDQGVINIRRNVTVERKFTDPKNRKSTRTIHLLEPAVKALRAQQALTLFSPLRTIQVELKGSAKTREERVRFVFIPASRSPSISTGITYKTTTYNRLWTRALKRSNIRHRCSYQSRHTYACWLITRGANLSFIAEEMGHTGTGMLERVYGRFMESHANEQVAFLNQQFNINR